MAASTTKRRGRSRPDSETDADSDYAPDSVSVTFSGRPLARCRYSTIFTRICDYFDNEQDFKNEVMKQLKYYKEQSKCSSATVAISLSEGARRYLYRKDAPLRIGVGAPITIVCRLIYT